MKCQERVLSKSNPCDSSAVLSCSELCGWCANKQQWVLLPKWTEGTNWIVHRSRQSCPSHDSNVCNYCNKNHIFIICIIWESYPWLQFIHNLNWHMGGGMLVYPRTKMNLSLPEPCLCVVSTLATVAPLHLCCQYHPYFSHDKNGNHCLPKHLRCTPSKWKCPLISLQNPKIISCRLMYSNFIIFGVREWQQDFWLIAYNIAIFSVYSTSCVLPPTELNFTCGWSSYTWSGQLLDYRWEYNPT